MEDQIKQRKQSTTKELFDLLLISIKEDDELVKPNISKSNEEELNKINQNDEIHFSLNNLDNSNISNH